MFKKLVYCGAILALATSCSEDFDNWASPQSNAPEESQSVQFAAVAADDIDIATADDVIPLFTYVLGMPEGYVYDSLSVDVVDAETEKVSPLEYLAEDDYVSVAKTTLATVVEGMYGKRPTARDLTLVTRAYAYTSAAKTTVVRSLTDTVRLKVTPEAPVIESAYYYVGAANGWSDSDQTYKLSNGDADPYENPVFTVTVPAVGGDHWFKIAPASAYTREEGFWGGDMVGVAVNGMSDLEGKIVVGQNDAVAQSWKIDEGANGGLYYTISINLLDQTYTITPLNFGSWLYEIGNESGWSASHPLYGPNNDGKYQGYYYLDGQFKFKPNEDNWDGDYECIGEGKIGQGSDNCPDPGAGFYQIDVDLAAGTYNLTKVNSITVVGNFNGWNQADQGTHMTYNVEGGYWEATLNLDSNGFKFAMNDDWAISWGGSNGDPAAYNDLTQNGGKDLDLPADGAGSYNIKLYLSYEGGNKVVLTKQ